MKNNFTQKGFVALFTVLITSVVLAMAIGIASLSLKEIVLSSSASDGNKAFYAADSGIECALYFEKNYPIAGTFLNELNCNGLPPFDRNEISTADPEKYTFSIELGENKGLCADVTVDRSPTLNPFYTVRIESKGSNVPCGAEGDNNPKKVERSIRVTY